MALFQARDIFSQNLWTLWTQWTQWTRKFCPQMAPIDADCLREFAKKWIQPPDTEKRMYGGVEGHGAKSTLPHTIGRETGARVDRPGNVCVGPFECHARS